MTISWEFCKVSILSCLGPVRFGHWSINDCIEISLNVWNQLISGSLLKGLWKHQEDPRHPTWLLSIPLSHLFLLAQSPGQPEMSPLRTPCACAQPFTCEWSSGCSGIWQSLSKPPSTSHFSDNPIFASPVTCQLRKPWFGIITFCTARAPIQHKRRHPCN